MRRRPRHGKRFPRCATAQIALGNAQYDYHLGPERSYISIDSETLEVRFGSDRTVGRVAIHWD